MSEGRDAEAVLLHADEWYSRRLDERYTSQVVKSVYAMMLLESRRIPLHELGHLKVDFARSFPIKDGYFSRHYSRFDGYAENSWQGGPEKDTRELETMAPAFEIKRKSHEFAAGLSGTSRKQPVSSLDELAVDETFTSTFGTLGDFTAFCLGYLRTRALNAHTKRVWKIDGGQHEMRKRNFRRVWGAVNYFNICVFGDLLDPSTSSSRTLMPPQYPFGDACALPRNPLPL